MTLSASAQCQWCGTTFATDPGVGRPRRYCRRSHRQRAYEARRLAAAHRLGPDDVLVDRGTWRGLADHRYRLQAAVEDVLADLADDPDATRQALAHLLDAAQALLAFPLEPKALGTASSAPGTESP